ncbi:hypothetical protein D3C79_859940 [compost metagenome]
MGNHVDEGLRQLDRLMTWRPGQWRALANHLVEQFECREQLVVVDLAVFRQVVAKVVGGIDLAGVVRGAEDQLQVARVELMIEQVVPQVFLVEEVPVAVVFCDCLAGPYTLWHGFELCCPALCVAIRTPAVGGMDGVHWVFCALAVSRPAVAGHVLILAPEPAGSINPAGHGLEAGSLG